MYIEQLRIDSRNLSLEERERYSWLFGDKAINDGADKLIDAEDESAALQRELEGVQEEADAQECQREHMQDAMDQVAAFLSSEQPFTRRGLQSVADAIAAFDPTDRGACRKLEEALEALKC